MCSPTSSDPPPPPDCISIALLPDLWCEKCAFFHSLRSKNKNAVRGKSKNSSTKCDEPFHEENKTSRFENKRLAYQDCQSYLLAQMTQTVSESSESESVSDNNLTDIVMQDENQVAQENDTTHAETASSASNCTKNAHNTGYGLRICSQPSKDPLVQFATIPHPANA